MVPWTEKHRPKRLSDITSHTDVIKVLSKIVQTKNLPHLLFYGPPGTGKTSAAIALAKELFGALTDRVLELNASDDRGISVVRHKIKTFASLAVAGGEDAPSFKMVILDEADWMTNDAQNALRRVMEKHSAVTRFCLICNYVSRIIAPIASRCSKFHFKALSENTVVSKLAEIGRREGLAVGEPVLAAINRMAAGDLRQGVTLLQSANEIFGDSVSADGLSLLAIEPPDSDIKTLIKTCGNGDVEKIRSAVREVIRSGYSIKAILAKLCENTAAGVLADIKKAKAVKILAEAEVSVANGADSELQLLNAMCQIDALAMQ